MRLAVDGDIRPGGSVKSNRQDVPLVRFVDRDAKRTVLPQKRNRVQPHGKIILQRLCIERKQPHRSGALVPAAKNARFSSRLQASCTFGFCRVSNKSPKSAVFGV
jgi:hypothetical protein